MFICVSLERGAAGGCSGVYMGVLFDRVTEVLTGDPLGPGGPRGPIGPFG